MSTWEDMKSGMRSVTNKVIKETDELAEYTALAIKKKKAELALSAAYEKLGKLTYRLLPETETDFRTQNAVLNVVKEIDEKRADLNELEAQLRRARENKKADSDDV